MIYPRDPSAQGRIISSWKVHLQAAEAPPKPVMQPLYIDLLEEPDAPAQSIHLGLRVGVNESNEYLKTLQSVGVNHVALNLRFNRMDTEATMRVIAESVLPSFLEGG